MIKITASALSVTEDELDRIKKHFGKTEKQLQDDIGHLKNWLAKQQHLPPKIDDFYLEKWLRMNKFSLEKVKKKIDMYYSIKHIVPELFEIRDMLGPKMQNHQKVLMLCPLPRLTKDLSRVHIFKYINGDPDLFDLHNHINYLFSIGDLRFFYDDCLTDTYIIDMSKLSLNHMLKLNLVTLKKCATVVEKAYSDRIKGVHFLNLPNFGHTCISIANSMLNAKIANRVYVHKNVNSLHKIISKKILPLDYGGTEKKLDEINDNWKKVLEENNDWLQEIAQQKSSEDLRKDVLNDGDIFGSMHGSFRKLDLD